MYARFQAGCHVLSLNRVASLRCCTNNLASAVLEVRDKSSTRKLSIYSRRRKYLGIMRMNLYGNLRYGLQKANHYKCVCRRQLRAETVSVRHRTGSSRYALFHKIEEIEMVVSLKVAYVA
jgi:hypothetical protein